MGGGGTVGEKQEEKKISKMYTFLLNPSSSYRIRADRNTGVFSMGLGTDFRASNQRTSQQLEMNVDTLRVFITTV